MSNRVRPGLNTRVSKSLASAGFTPHYTSGSRAAHSYQPTELYFCKAQMRISLYAHSQLFARPLPEEQTELLKGHLLRRLAVDCGYQISRTQARLMRR